MEKIPILIDTDLGDDVDDTAALIMALRSPELDIVGITTVYHDTKKRVQMVKDILSLAGREDIPVIAGRGCGIMECGAERIEPLQYDAYEYENEASVKSSGPDSLAASFIVQKVQEISGLVTETEISNHIMGCEMDTSIHKKEVEYGERLIEINHVSYTDPSGIKAVRDVSMSVNRGMIFGLAGVQGNGQVELVRMMTKALPVQQGSISFHNRNIQDVSLEKLRETSFGYIPEDRLEQGIAGAESIQDNMIANRLHSDKFIRNGVLRLPKIKEFVNRNIEEYAIRCDGPQQSAAMLSGGNMQKVVVARECQDIPDILIAEQPTRGVDIGAAHIIHEKMVSMRDQGCAILLVTADLNELLKLADVAAVMYEGELVGFFDHMQNLDEEKIGRYMLGIERDDPAQIGKAVNLG